MRHELTKAIEDTARAVVNEVHTAMPGKIVSFDAACCMAEVKPCGRYVTSDGKSLEYPAIAEVPVVFPFCQQAGVGMAFPVKKGDSCLLIVSEVELDEWRDGAESEGSLRYDLSSAVAIPGLLSAGGGLIVKAMKMDAVVLGTPGAELMVSKDSILADVNGITLEVSESGITAGGNLKVLGNISYTGSISNG